MGWKAEKIDLGRYHDLVYECAVCNARRKISDTKVYLRGNGNRFVVECDKCEKPSIVRFTGTRPSEFRVFTEARLPDTEQYQKRDGPKRRFDTA